jgi:hypothetical protein
MQRITPEYRALFTDVVEAPPETYTYAGKRGYHNIKLSIDLLTPYDQTLCLDADTLATPLCVDHIAKLVESEHAMLFSVPVCAYEHAGIIQTVGSGMHYTWWFRGPGFAKDALVKAGFSVKNFVYPQLQSTYIYFDREATKDYFASCRLTKQRVASPTEWGQDAPDEVYFALGWAAAGLPVHQPYLPVFIPIFGTMRAWGVKDRNAQAWNARLLEQACAMRPFWTLGGNNHGKKPWVAVWNNQITDACQKLGINHLPLLWEDKAKFDPTRERQ